MCTAASVAPFARVRHSPHCPHCPARRCVRARTSRTSFLPCVPQNAPRCASVFGTMAAARLPVFPTRQNLQLMKVKLTGAKKGHSLLKKKADALSMRLRALLKNILEAKENVGLAFREGNFALAEVKYAAGDIKPMVIESVGTAQARVPDDPDRTRIAPVQPRFPEGWFRGVAGLISRAFVSALLAAVASAARASPLSTHLPPRLASLPRRNVWKSEWIILRASRCPSSRP